MRISMTRGTSPPSDTAEPVGADRLYRDHSAYIAAFLGRLGVFGAAVDDAVQDVFMVAHLRGGYRPGPASPRTWLGAIAVRVAANTRRSIARKRELLDHRDMDFVTGPSQPEVATEQRQQLARVQRALSTLADPHRNVFLRFMVAGQSCGEIAEAMKIPTGTVYSRLHAARRSFVEACTVLGIAA